MLYKKEKANFLICGAGIVGLTIARKLLQSGHENIVILEKENGIGKHASGRNSGVLHAGIYYTPDSLKAKLCFQGNMLMQEYCKERSLPLANNRKVVVAKNEKELETLKELYDRGIKNGAQVELIDEKQLEEIEPNAKTFKMALYSYHTAVIDPKAVLNSLHDDLVSSGKVQFFTNMEFTGVQGSGIAVTNKGNIEFDTFINAAGTFSDRVAHIFGVGTNYKLIPFKGIYRKLVKEKSSMVNGSIYPVPNIRNPFLGIHLTKNVNGEVYIGPTAIPAFGRENYGIIKGLDKEVLEILFRDISLFISNSEFRKVATTEPRKYIFKNFFEDVSNLIKNISPDDIENSNKVGIRPQLVDWKSKELVMDFVVIKEGSSIHILNAISPAFTSSMAFAELIVNEYI